MKKLIIQIFFISLGLNNTLYVPHDFITIQEAIEASVDNDTIMVSEGEYYENINFIGKSIIVIGENINNTIIDGSQNSSVVRFENDEDNNSILDGFSIRNGKSQYGGGIYLSGASPQIKNIKIYDNLSEGGGGGGLYCIDSNPILENIEIYNNNSDDVGGGIYLKGNSNPLGTKVAIYNNYGSGAGGGIFVRDESEPHLDHSTIILNQTGTWGGGIAGKYGVNIKITNSIIRDNLPQQLAMSQYDDNQNIFVISTSNIQNEADSILTGNNDNIYWLDGNIDLDPLFIEDDLLYAIGFSSPCIDLGLQDTMLLYNNNQNSLYIQPYDFEGLNPDIGAYEFICEFPSYYDDCGICSFGDTGHEPNSDMDDCGVCFGNNEDLDCAGVCFGDAYYDECNVCDDIVENDNECITTLEILDSVVESGGESFYELSLSNSVGVVGLQFQIEDSPNLLRTIDVLSTSRTENFSIFFNEVGNILYVAAFNDELVPISPGNGPILDIVYDIDNVDEEQEVLLELSNVILSDINAESITSYSVDGLITVVMDILLGDINNDDIINILDAILLVEIIIYDGDYSTAADLNEDNIINILDIVILIDVILEN